MIQIQVGSTITNGSSAIRVTERVEKDPRWKAPGWRGLSIPMEAFGGNPGTTTFVPDYLAREWWHVPFEWGPVTGCPELEARYVWADGYRWLQREVRQIDPVPADCRSEHDLGHPDCPKCWRWSDRNPNAVPRP